MGKQFDNLKARHRDIISDVLFSAYSHKVEEAGRNLTKKEREEVLESVYPVICGEGIPLSKEELRQHFEQKVTGYAKRLQKIGLIKD